ncbi:MAG: hypothetical protein HC888_05220 [Candidatus Competibacteraceae bacterium]|nr:hypothetical protein [Candidatus Competibacteraceae bacterium]
MREIIFQIALALLPPCQFEDSTVCVWDAAAQGNRMGASFIALTETIIIYKETKE